MELVMKLLKLSKEEKSRVRKSQKERPRNREKRETKQKEPDLVLVSYQVPYYSIIYN
jgi:hypothetical protein